MAVPAETEQAGRGADDGAMAPGRRRGPWARRAAGAVAAALLGAWAGGPASADSHLSPVPAKPVAGAERPDMSSFGAYLAGRFAHARRDYSSAAAYFLRALEGDPDNPSLLRRTVSLLVADGRIEEAVELGRRLAGVETDARLARLLLGLRDARAGDFETALSHIAGIRRDGHDAFLPPLVEGWMQLGNDDLEAAFEALAPLGDRESHRPFFALHAGFMNDIAGRPTEAESLFQEAVASSNGSLRSVAALGRFLDRAGRGGDARAVHEDYRRRNPGSVWAEQALDALAAGGAVEPLVSGVREGLAEALFGAANAVPRHEGPEGGDAALVYARLALFLRDDFDAARLLVGEFLESAGRPEEAGAVYRSIAPDSIFAWTARLRAAASLADLGRLDEAVAALRDMVDERADRSDAAVMLGDLLRRSERYAEAVPAYDTAIERTPGVEDRHWSLFYARGVALERTGAWPRAEADFLHALALHPDRPLVLNYLGYSWVEQRRNLDRAKAMIEKAVSLRPDDGYIVDSLGWVLYRLGDYEEAVRQLERAVELRSGDPVINDHLGDAYWRVERRNEARYQWRRALGFGIEDDLADAIRRKLVEGLTAGAEPEGTR